MSKFLTAIDVTKANDETETTAAWIKRIVSVFAAEEGLSYQDALEYFVSYGIGRRAALARAKEKADRAKTQAKVVPA